MPEEREDILDELIVEERHREILTAFGRLTSAMSKKDDPELKKLIENTNQAINNFGRKVDQLNGAPDVKVETNQDKVVASINSIFKELIPVLKGIDERLTKLESRPLPTKLKAVKDSYTGGIDYVIIEYKK